MASEAGGETCHRQPPGRRGSPIFRRLVSGRRPKMRNAMQFDPAALPLPPRDPFRLGELEVRPASNEIVAGGAVQRLRPLLMQLLLRLAAEPGQVVRRETLLAEAWPRRMVADEVLSRTIAELRTALGDEAKQARYIETLPKVGYRLIAPVSRQQPAPSRPEAAPHAAWPCSPRWPSPLAIAARLLARLARPTGPATTTSVRGSPTPCPLPPTCSSRSARGSRPTARAWPMRSARAALRAWWSARSTARSNPKSAARPKRCTSRPSSFPMASASPTGGGRTGNARSSSTTSPRVPSARSSTASRRRARASTSRPMAGASW